MARIVRIVLAALAAVASVVVGVAATLVVTVALMDWNRFRAPLAEQASALTGRPLTIDGDLSLDLLTLTPALVAHDVRFANPEWAADEDMAEIGRLAVQADLRALVRGRLRILGLTLSDGIIRLEKDAEGRANWNFSAADGPGAAAVEAVTPEDRTDVPDIERLTFESMRIQYTDAEAEPLLAEFETLVAEAGADGVTLDTEGTWQEAPFTIEGTLGSLDSLQQADAPYPVDLTVHNGDTSARIDGTIADPLAFTGIDTALTLTGPSLDALSRILGLPLPPTPQYELRGRLSSDGDSWRLADFDGRLGASDLSGTLTVTLAEDAPLIEGHVASDLLDFEDLQGLLGDEDVRGAAAGAQAPAAPSGGLFPNDPIDMGGLQAVNAHVHFTGHEIRRGGSILQDVETTAKLDGGRLVLDPLKLGLAGGTVAGTVTVDASAAETLAVAAAGRVRKLDLKVLVGDLDPQLATWGELDGRLDLSGQGRSAHEIASTLQGEAVLYMGRGGIGNVLLEAIGLDVTEVIASLFSTDPDSPLECIILPLKVQNGVVHGDPMLLEAAQDTVLGDGTFDLATGALSVRLRVRPHDYSLFNAPSVLTVEGTAGGEIGVDKSELVGQALKKILMAPLSPFMTEEDEGLRPCEPVRRKLGPRQG